MADTYSASCEETISEVRKECRQFAMLYFQFCKVLYKAFGRDKAIELVSEAIFNLSIERTEGARQQAQVLGIDYSLESFQKVNDLPTIGWVKDLGRNHCPYAQQWLTYFEMEPWFSEFAPLYCDVIDTTNIENFTKKLSHKITSNVLTDKNTSSCEHIYFENDDVANGKLTYKPKIQI